MPPVAIIGGGLAGLTAAIRLAQQGIAVELFEAASKAGGRTRSFFDTTTQTLCDNGPHLLAGAYRATQALLHDCAAEQHLHWQTNLELPLWEQQRGHFHFTPATWLPFPLALLHAAAHLPGHRLDSATGMLRLARAMRHPPHSTMVAADWLQHLQLPAALLRDLLEPLCLGAMNAPIDSANAASFSRVLAESFRSREHARLGWFNKPLDLALIEPLISTAIRLGVRLHLRHLVRGLEVKQQTLHIPNVRTPFSHAILALPAYARDRLLKQKASRPCNPITNVHLWFAQPLTLPAPFIGGIGTTGEWFFDVSSQLREQNKHHHICVVISAERSGLQPQALVKTVVQEIQTICGAPSLQPLHYRIVKEQRATALVEPAPALQALPANMIDASEAPQPGDLPATIELAVLRGEITNVHLWFAQPLTLPAPFIGGIGTTGEWFFDVSSQLREQNKHHHICVVISAERSGLQPQALVKTVVQEIQTICGAPSLQPLHYRIVKEQRATALVEPAPALQALPANMIDASEAPQPGDLPATIELAVLRGEQAAAKVLADL